MWIALAMLAVFVAMYVAGASDNDAARTAAGWVLGLAVFYALVITPLMGLF